MATTSASGGGNRPPNQHQFRILGNCEQDYHLEDNDEELQSLPKKRKRGERGDAKGHVVEKTIKKLGVDKLPLIWNPVDSIPTDIGPHHGKFASQLGKVIRSNVPPYHQKWEDVDEDKKDIIFQEIRAKFKPLDDHHRNIVMDYAGVLYRKWKNRLSTIVKKHEEEFVDTQSCPRPSSVKLQSEWDQYIDYYNSAAFQERSTINSKNRRCGNQRGRHGRKPVYARRFEGLKEDATTVGDDVVERDPIDLWAELHRNDDGSWIDAESEAAHRMLEHFRTVIAPGPRRRLTVEEEEDIFKRAMGERRDLFIGRGPRRVNSRSSAKLSQPSYHGVNVEQLIKEHEKLKQLQEKMKQQHEKLKKKSSKQRSILDYLVKDYNDRKKTVLNIGSDDDDDDGTEGNSSHDEDDDAYGGDEYQH